MTVDLRVEGSTPCRFAFFVGIRISNQHLSSCSSRAVLALLSRLMFVCVCVVKKNGKRIY